MLSSLNSKDFKVKILISTWLIALAGSLLFLYQYQFKNLDFEASFTHFPSQSNLAFDDSKYNLYAFLHPMCVCSEASLDELNNLLHEVDSSKINSQIIFLNKGILSKEKIKEAKLYKQAKYLEKHFGTKIIFDEDGKEISLFKAMSSGGILAYSKDRELLFQGGITDSRGHRGYSRGRDYLKRLFKGERLELETLPVFGCALNNQ